MEKIKIFPNPDNILKSSIRLSLILFFFLAPFFYLEKGLVSDMFDALFLSVFVFCASYFSKNMLAKQLFPKDFDASCLRKNEKIKIKSVATKKSYSYYLGGDIRFRLLRTCNRMIVTNLGIYLFFSRFRDWACEMTKINNSDITNISIKKLSFFEKIKLHPLPPWKMTIKTKGTEHVFFVHEGDLLKTEIEKVLKS